MSGGEGQRTAALKDKLAALKLNVGRRPRKSATRDDGAPGGAGDVLSSWRQRRGRDADGPGGVAAVDWDFIDAAATRGGEQQPGMACVQRRSDGTEGDAQFEAVALARLQRAPASTSGAGLNEHSGAGSDGHLREGAGRDGRGASGSGGGDGGGQRDGAGSELSFEERLARVLAASAAVLRKAQEREAPSAGAPSPPREAQAAQSDVRGTAAGSPTHRGGPASPAEVDTIDDVLERWRRQRKAESASLGWAAPPSALAVLAAEQATAVAQQAVDAASASLKATPPRQQHAEPRDRADGSTYSGGGGMPSPEASLDVPEVPRRTPPSARRALALDGTQQQTAGSPPSPPDARLAGGLSPGTRSQHQLLGEAVTAALTGLEHASPGAAPRHGRSPVSLGYDLFGGDDMAQLLQGTVESMLFGGEAAMRPAARHGGMHTPPAMMSPARRGGSPGRGADAPAEPVAPWQGGPGVLVSTPPRAASSAPSPLRTPSPVRLSPSIAASSPGDEIVDHLKARIAACRLELSQLGL